MSLIFVDGKRVSEKEFQMASMYYNRLSLSGITDPADKIRWARKRIAHEKGDD